MPNDPMEYLQKVIEAIDENPLEALHEEILHKNAESEMKAMNEDKIEGLLNNDNLEKVIQYLKELIRQTDRKDMFCDPYR